MSQELTADLQNRILGLKAELDALSVKLQAIQTPPAPETPASAEPVDAAAEPAVTRIRKERDLSRASTRTLRDLLWQGRWSLAYHLAKALEAQQAPAEFASTTIRAWTLAVTAERRSGFEASALIQELCRPREGEDSLAERTLKWAAIIGLLRAIDPSEVRACASLFTPPTELATTAGWWSDYVEALASAARPAARWLSLPEQDPVTSEINELMIGSDEEAVRLAASCLMMSVKTAMRRVHVASAADARFVLNSELARKTSVAFNDKGEVTTLASEVERAICELAVAASPAPQPLLMEAPIGMKEEPVVADSLLEAPTPRAQLALERLEAVEESLQSAVNEHRAPAAADESLRESRRAAARERLNRYTERLAARTESRATIPMRPMLVGAEDNARQPGRAASPRVSEGVVRKPVLSVTPVVNAPPVRITDSVPIAEAPVAEGPITPPVSLDDRRGIHETAVAYAFADPTRSAKSGAPTSVRPYNDASIWSSLLTPQAAIVGGLMVIASAILAGLGNGLTASSPATTPAVDHSTADAGDFQAVQ